MAQTFVIVVRCPLAGGPDRWTVAENLDRSATCCIAAVGVDTIVAAKYAATVVPLLAPENTTRARR